MRNYQFVNRVCTFILLLCLTHFYSISQIYVSENNVKEGAVQLDDCTLLVDSSENILVKTVSGLFVSDIQSVTGKNIEISYQPNSSSLIILGTTKSRHIRELIKRKKIDVSEIENSTERFKIAIVDSPFKGVSKSLVIVGSDPRGLAYGVLTISEKIGVSPWYWWADVPVKTKKRIYISGNYTSRTPSVRYRGIFLNDEDWGLKPWAEKTFEPECGNIGPKTYAKICELILRLKGNMLAPAMHSCSTPFYHIDENKLVADSFGIMITTSHCEPLLFNNASKLEWDSQADGEWNYKTNRTTIYNKLDNRIKTASKYENIYTLAMRGLHDEGMRGDMSTPEKVNMLQQAITDQRDILHRYIKQNIDSIPQIFIPYKEAQELYENGLKVPEHVTLIWPDDNYGYIKMLSNPEERRRKGRSGVYYHISYLGLPHDYLWLNTTPPMLMFEELKKAYDTGADRYWLLNVGDIKPMELAIQTFFDMAWDITKFNYENINLHQSDFAGAIYGQKYSAEINEILNKFYKLAWSRKPEYMGWEREWDSPQYTGLKDPEYSFKNYNEARLRLSEYNLISEKCQKLYQQLPQILKSSFFEMIGFPVMAAYQMNRKFLMAKLNHEMADINEFAKANWAANQVIQAYDSLNNLISKYNELENGKWRNMMTLPPGLVALYHKMPEIIRFENAGSEEIELTPSPKKEVEENYYVIPLESYSTISSNDNNSIRILEGIGYDWKSVQLGEASQPPLATDDKYNLGISYKLPPIISDSISVTIYTVPRFPLYKGASTKYAISFDTSEPYVVDEILKEHSKSWRDQVLQNGNRFSFSHKINPDKKPQTINIFAIDPGLIIQRIIIEWGERRESYLGPARD